MVRVLLGATYRQITSPRLKNKGGQSKGMVRVLLAATYR